MITDYFDKIFIINLKRREDRWKECLKELAYNNISINDIERFEACDRPENGHVGCTRSHRILIRLIAASNWKRVLVLEDDFQVITRDVLTAGGFKSFSPAGLTFETVLHGDGDLSERFDYLTKFIPDKWDVLYLGASYGEDPISRVNEHVIRCGFMQGTSSYGITNEFAKVWTQKVDDSLNSVEGTGGEDLIRHPGPIDSVFGRMSHDHLYYVLQPRLMTQRASFSDLDGGTNSRRGQGMDVRHEGMV